MEKREREREKKIKDFQSKRKRDRRKLGNFYYRKRKKKKKSKNERQKYDITNDAVDTREGRNARKNNNEEKKKILKKQIKTRRRGSTRALCVVRRHGTPREHKYLQVTEGELYCVRRGAGRSVGRSSNSCATERRGRPETFGRRRRALDRPGTITTCVIIRVYNNNFHNNIIYR